MKKESILYSIIGLLAGLLITGATAVIACNSDNHGMMRMMGMNPESHHPSEASGDNSMSMSQMSQQLKNLSGDEFDKTFIEMMIAHHQGAIEMAELSASNARHEEIKKLSRDIISAQTAEINQLRQWQMDWGYSSSDSMMQMDH